MRCGISRAGAGRSRRARLRPWPVIALALALASSAGCTPPVDPALEVSAEEPVRARAAIEPDTATLGERIELTVEVAHREGLAVELPALPESFGGLRVEAGEPPAETLARRGQVVERRRYLLVAERVGVHTIPPLEVAYGSEGELRETVATSELTVEVPSLLATEEAEATDIRDVKPLRRQRARWMTIVLPLVALAALAALLGWWWWRRRRRSAAEPAPLPPYEAALEALARLRQTDFGDPEAVRAYYFALSETVRVYVEGRFGLNATDLTSEEIVASLGELQGLSAEDSRRLRDFLDATDQVKFAQLIPSSRQIEETFETAVSFVESTRPAESEKPGEEKARPQDQPPRAASGPPASLRPAEGGG
ncbi:MAG TPA: BatD family protein [Thermoanaerobaculia bacterium]|nr:BatD family protein [Thermoanaerobaculia bacterium]